MKFLIPFILMLAFSVSGKSQGNINASLTPGYEQRIKDYIDTLKIFDTHEHLFNPEQLKKTNFLDFTMLLQPNSYDDLISSGMSDTVFKQLFNDPLTPLEKWRIIEPFWGKSFNTTYNRVLLQAIRDLYGTNDLNENTVETLSTRIKKAYEGDWYTHVFKDLCRIDYILQDGEKISLNNGSIRYVKRFSSWLSVRTKYRIDSLAVMQIEPIYTLEDYVKSMRVAFEAGLKEGMVAVKINMAYNRTLSFDKVTTENARKVFRTLINGNEDLSLSLKEAKPLQDFMLFQLLDLAQKDKIPVAFHTGLQAGNGNIISDSDPSLLANLFLEYPEINFVLFHGSYPFGGELSTLAKNFSNVYIDMNWSYSISPTYSERYLTEWLETVPASKIMAFGGDQKCVENTYGELIIAKKVISGVLINKVREGYLSEAEAKTVAKMILYDNAVRFYGLH
jgi:hypothetical protein